MDKLFQIGEMAKLFHLSVSSIRHYEEIGLILPEYVDPDTGYRYYSTRQFEAFNGVRYLRALGMPLGEIRDVFQNRGVGNMEEKLRRQKQAVVEKQQELKRIERKIDNRLRQLEEARTSPLDEIRQGILPAGRMVVLHRPMTIHGSEDMEEPVSALTSGLGEPVAFLGKIGLLITPERLRAGAFEGYDGIFLLPDPEDRVKGNMTEVPASPCVFVRYRGHHADAKQRYWRLLSYIRERGLTISGPSREITLIDYGITDDPEEFVTEICIPVHTGEM